MGRADVYMDSEELVGKWFKRSGKRNDIFLATKFGFTPAGICGKAEYVKEAAEKSLKRLGTNTIDLYYLHRCVSLHLMSCSIEVDYIAC